MSKKEIRGKFGHFDNFTNKFTGWLRNCYVNIVLAFELFK